jgi:flagellar protein FlaG
MEPTLPPLPAQAVDFRPQATLPKTGVNSDAQVIAKIASAEANPQASVKEQTVELRQAVDHAARQIERFISSMERSVRVSKDGVTGYMIVQLINPQTGEVIRSLPSDELLRIARHFEVLGSVMVNQRA